MEEEHRPTGADSSHLRRRFRTTENTQNSEKNDTQDTVKAEEEIRHGDRQDQEIATRGSRLRAATLGSWPSLLVLASRVRRKDAPGSGAVRHRKLDAPYRLPATGYQLTSLRALSDLRGSIPPVLSPWSIPPGELTPWPPHHKSKPTAAMPKRAAGRKPRRGRPAYGATPSNTA